MEIRKFKLDFAVNSGEWLLNHNMSWTYGSMVGLWTKTYSYYPWMIRIDCSEELEYREDCIYIDDKVIEKKRDDLINSLIKQWIDKNEDEEYFKEMVNNLKTNNYLVIRLGKSTLWMDKYKEAYKYQDITYLEWVVKGILE